MHYLMRASSTSGSCRQLRRACVNIHPAKRLSNSASPQAYTNPIDFEDSPDNAAFRQALHSRDDRTKAHRKVPSRAKSHGDAGDPYRMLTRDFGIRYGQPLAKNVNDSPPQTPELYLRDGKLLMPSYNDYDPEPVEVPGRWLRDVCACVECRHPDTAQRRVNVLHGDAARTKLVSAELGEWPRQLKVTFADGHETVVPGDTLVNRRNFTTTRRREGIVPVSTWTRSIRDDPPSVDYADKNGLGNLLLRIRTHGFCFVDSMPATPEATEALLSSIGPIRNTHYGAFYDFTSDLASKDTAYTSEALDPHTDNTYFTEPAGLQALHMLSHTDGSGGESSLVDGFACAEQLYRENAGAYYSLSKTGVYAHASGNEGISIQPAQAFPTFTHSSQHNTLMQVRWNNADRAGVAASWRHLDEWYDAAAAFDALVNDSKNQYWFQLKPGRMLLFDNWRVLHGRAAFTGKRRMCGGYINRDDFVSKFKATNYSREEVEASTVTG